MTATLDASRPRIWSVASTTCQLAAISPGLGVYVLMNGSLGVARQFARRACTRGELVLSPVKSRTYRRTCWHARRGRIEYLTGRGSDVKPRQAVIVARFGDEVAAAGDERRAARERHSVHILRRDRSLRHGGTTPASSRVTSFST